MNKPEKHFTTEEIAHYLLDYVKAYDKEKSVIRWMNLKGFAIIAANRLLELQTKESK